MTDELVAYLLDDLCPQRRAEVERRLESDAEWQREFDRLKECFAECGDPCKCVDEPPRDLVTRTCCMVEKVERRPSSAGGVAMTAAAVAGSRASSWSFTDMAVAGGVVLTLGMLMAPSLRESRDAARRLACQDNLRVLGSGLYDYQEKHGHWLPPIGPRQSVSLFAVALADHVGMDRAELTWRLVCPDSIEADQIASGERVPRIPAYAEFANASPEQLVRLNEQLPVSYAYRAGYEDERGGYHQPKYTGAADELMMSDAPAISSTGVRSQNHVGGQNVLTQQVGVDFRTNCQLASRLDNIFLNARGEHAAGCDKDDVVLMRGNSTPDGDFIIIVPLGIRPTDEAR
jgi:hypothetical protein